MVHTDKTVWVGRKLGGYAGLKHTASKIKQFIPKCKVYCEPFAGLARVAELGIDCEYMVLNDKSPFAVEYLDSHFPELTDTVRSFDFKQCIELYDEEDTFFLIDPPWRREIYEEGLTDAVCDRPILQYYTDLLELLPTIKGDWILCSATWQNFHKKFVEKGYYLKTVESDKYVIFGKKSKVNLISNKPFKENYQ